MSPPFATRKRRTGRDYTWTVWSNQQILSAIGPGWSTRPQRSALLGHTHPGSITAYEHLLPMELVRARQRENEGLAAYLADTSDGDYGRQLWAQPR